MSDYVKLLENTIVKYNGKHILSNVKKDGLDFLKIHSKKSEATYMFIDIKGFTKISDQIITGTLLDDLNIYFSGISDSILKNNGYIDSFIGDAIFAFFGLANKYHADDACKSALDSLDKLNIINQKIKNKNVFQVGIGINTGLSAIGNIGSNLKLKFTAMGDAVNIASRMESLTSKYNAQIIISENTKSKLTKNFAMNKLDTVAVKGLPEKVTVYELLSSYNDDCNGV